MCLQEMELLGEWSSDMNDIELDVLEGWLDVLEG